MSLKSSADIRKKERADRLRKTCEQTGQWRPVLRTIDLNFARIAETFEVLARSKLIGAVDAGQIIEGAPHTDVHVQHSSTITE